MTSVTFCSTEISPVPAPPSPIHADVSDWPLVKLRSDPRASSDDEVRALLQWLELHLTRREAYHAIVFDMRGTPPLTPAQRGMASAQRSRLPELTGKWCRGVAFVLDSSLARSALAFNNWLSPSPYPIRAFAHPGLAAAWCSGQLCEVGIPPPMVRSQHGTREPTQPGQNL